MRDSDCVVPAHRKIILTANTALYRKGSMLLLNALYMLLHGKLTSCDLPRWECARALLHFFGSVTVAVYRLDHFTYFKSRCLWEERV
jgi:hypothetical protein